jgi:hypothetical protein
VRDPRGAREQAGQLGTRAADRTGLQRLAAGQHHRDDRPCQPLPEQQRAQHGEHRHDVRGRVPPDELADALDGRGNQRDHRRRRERTDPGGIETGEPGRAAEHEQAEHDREEQGLDTFDEAPGRALGGRRLGRFGLRLLGQGPTSSTCRDVAEVTVARRPGRTDR